MCVRCDNENFIFSTLDNVTVDGENYMILTQDTKDNLSMILSGVTFGDTYAATVVIHTGDLIINTIDEYHNAVMDGTIASHVNESATLAYKGNSSIDAVESGHYITVKGIEDGWLPEWMTIEEQQDAVLYTDAPTLEDILGMIE